MEKTHRMESGYYWAILKDDDGFTPEWEIFYLEDSGFWERMNTTYFYATGDFAEIRECVVKR